MGSRKVGLKYRYQKFGLRNAVERFFRYIKQRTRRFKSIEDYATAIIRNLLHNIIKTQGRRITC